MEGWPDAVCCWEIRDLRRNLLTLCVTYPKQFSMNLYYVPEINADRLILPDEEARHCVQVLRLKEGDLLYLTNGTVV